MKTSLKRKLLLIGGGGHCHSVFDSLYELGVYDNIGIVDNTDCSFFDIPVLGTDEDIPKLKMAGWTDAFITVGSVGSTKTRRKLYKLVKKVEMNIPAIIDPSAIIAMGTTVSEGVYIGKGAVVNTGSIIGTCAIINTGAIIEHDCVVGDFSHISPGTTVCGQVCIGCDSHVGAGSVVRQQICIGDGVLIGAGSIVVKDIPDNVTAYGNPCKVVTK